MVIIRTSPFFETRTQYAYSSTLDPCKLDLGSLHLKVNLYGDYIVLVWFFSCVALGGTCIKKENDLSKYFSIDFEDITLLEHLE